MQPFPLPLTPKQSIEPYSLSRLNQLGSSLFYRKRSTKLECGRGGEWEGSFQIVESANAKEH